ncbi:MAG: hypothetical protein WCJ33_05435 [Pseudomonadota bacterium]
MGKTEHNIPKLRFPEFSGAWKIVSFGSIFERIVRKNIKKQ